MTKVSLIIPIYNTPITPLRECIESILNQSYKNIEVLLINDGSTDNCENICKEYCYDARVKLINKENGGVSSARNVGLQESTGDYVMFVDADDILTVDAVRLMVDGIIENQADIMICNYKRFFTDISKLELLSDIKKCRIFNTSSDLIKLRKKCLHEDDSLGIRFNGAPWGKLYSLNLIKNNDIRFDESLIRSQDNYFNFIVFGVAKKIGYINTSLYLYRYLPTSSVNRFRKNLFDISQKYISCVQRRIEEEGILSEYIDTLSQIKIEKFSEYMSSYIAHPNNTDPINKKVSKLKEIKRRWIEFADENVFFKQFSSYRTKILFKLIIKQRYTLAYLYVKTLNIIKQNIIKLYYIHG